MDKYEELKSLIAEAEDDVDFWDFGDGTSDEWIDKAEERLGIKFPNSYKWWLKNYRGGQIYGDEIFSIYEQDFDTVVGGDIVYMYELNIRNNNYKENMLVICEAYDEVFYFDLNFREGDEMPVFALHKNKKYADDFIMFLIKFIKE